MFELSDRAVDEVAAADPILATESGIAGHDDRWPDQSPDGFRDRRNLFIRLRADAEKTELAGPDDALARSVLTSLLSEWIDLIDADDYTRDMNNLASPHQMFRQVFDLMPMSDAEAWECIVTRLETIDQPLAGYRRSLEKGLAAADTAARRQVEAVIDQGEKASGAQSQFLGLVAGYEQSGIGNGTLSNRLNSGIAHAQRTFADFNKFLTDTYMAAARGDDAVGAERYVRAARGYLGTDIDPTSTYAWGWSEIDRLWERLQVVAAQIEPGSTVADTVELLQTDPNRAATSQDEFIDLMTERQLAALEHLSGTHFEVPTEIRAIEVKVDASGGSAAPYYTGPSEDFIRPGRVWYPIADRNFFPLFGEISTAYHEGFPGHHLQVGVQLCMAERLSRFHRVIVWYPGSGEGWALYAEHLMGELGYLEKPEYEVGLLAAQLMRACRIVIDIGMHLGLKIPRDASFHPGEAWTFELANELLITRALESPSRAASEVTRYLGWPGQAISYKIGEQAILDLRDEASADPGFDLKSWHTDLLGVGSVGLDLLRSHMRTRWPAGSA